MYCLNNRVHNIQLSIYVQWDDLLLQTVSMKNKPLTNQSKYFVVLKRNSFQNRKRKKKKINSARNRVQDASYKLRVCQITNYSPVIKRSILFTYLNSFKHWFYFLPFSFLLFFSFVHCDLCWWFEKKWKLNGKICIIPLLFVPSSITEPLI